jgi:hypothetical protein
MTKIMKKILTYAAITVAVLGLCGIAAINIQAESINGNYPPIIQKLAERFNLDINEVKEFFDENRGERMQERLTEAGLTTEQIEALRTKKEELWEEYGPLRDLSPEERRLKMQEMREEMEAWAEENGIDLSVLGGFGGKFGKGFGRGFRCFDQ